MKNGYKFIGVVCGKAVWKEFNGRESDTVSSTKYHANEVWGTHDGRYFITSYGRRVRKGELGINIHQRFWISEEDVKRLEEEGRLLKKWDYKVYDGDEVVSEGTILEEDVEELIKIIIKKLKKEGLIDYKRFRTRIDIAYVKGDYDRCKRIEVDLALETRLDNVFMGYYWDLIDVWTKTAHAKGMYYKKGMQEWGELRIFDYVVRFQRAFKP